MDSSSNASERSATEVRMGGRGVECERRPQWRLLQDAAAPAPAARTDGGRGPRAHARDSSGGTAGPAEPATRGSGARARGAPRLAGLRMPGTSYRHGIPQFLADPGGGLADLAPARPGAAGLRHPGRELPAHGPPLPDRHARLAGAGGEPVSALTEDRLRSLLAWVVIVLLAVPVGGALWLGVIQGESPCILCWAQRTSMVLIALVALFVVRYGPRPRYLGMVVLLAAWGTFMGLRHSALHLARDVGQGFSGAILGAHTYVWSWVIHWIVLLVVGVLLLLLRGSLRAADTPRPATVSRAGRFAMGLLVVIAGANAVQAFASTGPPPFIGQGDPIRLSLNPGHWVWSLGELEGSVSWRGSWTIPQPDPAAVEADPDPAHGPLAGLPVLGIQGWVPIRYDGFTGRLTDFAYATGGANLALAVTDDFGVYLLDGTLSRVLHRVVLGQGFSIDLSPLAGAVFVGDTLAVVATNKSYVLLRPDSAADPAAQWRFFRESDGGVAELRRARFATVRARQQYVLSLAYDPSARELLTVSVPSPRHRRLVVSRFDRDDLLLSSEFEPRLGKGLTLAPERTLAEYLVTGATVVDGRLFAISAAYSTLLAIDLQTKALVAAWAVPGLDRPVGVTARGNELLVAQADGRVAVLELPAAPGSATPAPCPPPAGRAPAQPRP
ncbi:MAG: disulfide bond formation protein B, partial [Gemmatimonadetes bacterium]|nr:disulfide bond formation protein B [Gemmatimonadota bacterium]